MKYVILLASIVIQVCLGGIYAWSSLVPALKESVHLSTAQTQIIFGVLFATFTVSMVVAGRLLDRLGPRVIAGIGGLFFGVGYLLASFSGGHLAVMLLGISLLAGVGTGLGYVCPLATCMKWFPDKRGLVTGISMAGFGGGAVLLTGLAEHLLSRGVQVLMVFRWIGIGYGVALLVASAMLSFPDSAKGVRPRRAPVAKALLRDPFFLSLVLGMFCGTFAGMLVIGNLKPIGLSAGISARSASAAIGAFAIGNASGRIVWGWISDRTDHWMIPVKLAALGLPLALLGWMNSPTPFIVVSFAVGFGFGACFVLYAAQVAARYGLARVGGVYPIVFLAYGVAGLVGPVLGGWLYDTTASYTPAIAISCGVVAVGLVGSILLLRQAKRSRMVPDATAGDGRRR